MKKRKLLSYVLLLAMLVSSIAALTACNGEGTGEVTTTAGEGTTSPGEETTIGSGVPDGLEFDDTVTWLIWSDHTMVEFYADQLKGEEVNDQIYDRNQKLQSDLGVTFNYVEEKGSSSHMETFQKKVEMDFSGDGMYEIIGSYSVSLPTLAQQGFLADALDEGFKYFDFEREWWPDNLVEQATIGGNLYFFSVLLRTLNFSK